MTLLLAIIFCQIAQGQTDHLLEYQRLKRLWDTQGQLLEKEELKQLLFHARHLHVDSVINLGNQALAKVPQGLTKPDLSTLYSFLSEAYTIRCDYQKADSLVGEALSYSAPKSEEQALAYRALAFVTMRKPDA